MDLPRNAESLIPGGFPGARCGLLVDQEGMASLTMADDQLQMTSPGFGEELLRSTTPPGCDACPAMRADGRRACIYDKVSSAHSA